MQSHTQFPQVPSHEFCCVEHDCFLFQVDGCLVQGLMNILDCYFEEFRPFEGVVKKSPEAAENLKESIEPMFMFALVWSLLATVDRKGREFMDQFIR